MSPFYFCHTKSSKTFVINFKRLQTGKSAVQLNGKVELFSAKFDQGDILEADIMLVGL